MTSVLFKPQRWLFSKKSVLFLTALMLAACQHQEIKSADHLINGTLQFSELSTDSNMHSSARIHLYLEDTQLADAPAQLISEVIYHVPSLQSPFSFSLPFAPQSLTKSGRYNLSVSVEVKNTQGQYREQYLNTEAYPVLIEGVENLSTPIVLHSLHSQQ